MMFVKYCPDPTLSAIFHLKTPNKWTALWATSGQRLLPVSNLVTQSGIMQIVNPALAISLHSHLRVHRL